MAKAYGTGNPFNSAKPQFDSGAAASGGPGWFMAVVETVAGDYPDVDILSILDCGDRPGDALAALRAGWKTIVYTGPAAAKIADIANQLDATVLRKRP